MKRKIVTLQGVINLYVQGLIPVFCRIISLIPIWKANNILFRIIFDPSLLVRYNLKGK